MLRNHRSQPRLGSHPGRLAATLAAAALLATLALPAQLLAAPAPGIGGTGGGPSSGLQLWLDTLWSWLGIPPAPPAEEDGPKAAFLPGGCAADPLGNCLDANETDPETTSSPSDTETSPETSLSG